MTLYSERETPRFTPRTSGASNPYGQGRSLRSAIGEIGGIVSEQFSRARTSARPMADGAGQRLSVAGRRAATEIRKRPIATTLAVIGAGVGLAMLLSGRSRAAAGLAGAQALKAYKRYRH